MTSDVKSRHVLKKMIKELSEYKARHTELISVYIPAGYDLNKIINHLQQEQGTATNIKSKQTRDNVISALERMIQHLKLFDRTPERGLAVFSGNVAEREGQENFQVWSVEPIEPLNQRIYRCDKDFKLEPLQDQLVSDEVYGLVVLDRRDATIALLHGKSIKVLNKSHSEVPGKMKAGGQSAQRFARLREGAIKDHYKKIADHMKDEFLGMSELKGIIIGGPSTTITDFLNKGYLTGDIFNKIIAKKDLSYTDEFGLQELLDKSQDVLAQEGIAQEKSVMQRFFKLLNTNPMMVAYGLGDIKRAIDFGAVDTLLLSEEVDDDMTEELAEKAEEMGSNVEFISTDTREGVQLKEMGKIAAILRFELPEE